MCLRSGERAAQGSRNLLDRWGLRPTCTLLKHILSYAGVTAGTTRMGIGLAAVARPAYITSGRAADLGAHRSVADLRSRTEAVLDAAYAAGIRYIDVARSYGRAEEFLAGWLAERGRADVIVGSKWLPLYRWLAAGRSSPGGQGTFAGHVHDSAGANPGPAW